MTIDRRLGSGFPAWLDIERFMGADEVRAFGLQMALAVNGGTCPICRIRPVTDKAHIWRGGMSGRGGPVVCLCRECHTGPEGVDRRGDRTLAVEREPVTVHHLVAIRRAHRVVLVDRSFGIIRFVGYLPAD